MKNIDKYEDFIDNLNTKSIRKMNSLKKEVFVLIGLSLATMFALFNLKVDEVTESHGVITTKKDIYKVQHLTNTRLKNLFVKNGDFVSPGQVLAVLHEDGLKDAISIQQNIINSTSQNIIALETLITEISNHSMPKIQAPSKTFDEELTQDVYRSYRDVIDKRLALLGQKISKNKSKESEFRDLIKIYNQKIQNNQKLHSIYQNSEVKGYSSKIESIVAHNNLLDVKRLKEELLIDVLELQSSNKLLEDEYEVFLKQKKEEIQSKLVEEQRTRDKAIEEKSALIKKEKMLTLVSPQEGIIRNIKFFENGSIIPSTDVLLEIVPEKSGYIAEVFIESKDIGHIKVGDPVHLRVGSFKFTKYGKIDGEIKYISASSFENENGQLAYKAEIQLDSTSMDHEGIYKVISGMDVQADIITGSSNILAYLVSPIRQIYKNSFREQS